MQQVLSSLDHEAFWFSNTAGAQFQKLSVCLLGSTTVRDLLVGFWAGGFGLLVGPPSKFE